MSARLGRRSLAILRFNDHQLENTFYAEHSQVPGATLSLLPDQARQERSARRGNKCAAMEDLAEQKASKRAALGISDEAHLRRLETGLSFVREGDTFVVTKIASRGPHRTPSGSLRTWRAEGWGLRILDFAGEPIATKSPHGKLVLTMFAAFAEFERKLMLERQRAGDC